MKTQQENLNSNMLIAVVRPDGKIRYEPTNDVINQRNELRVAATAMQNALFEIRALAYTNLIGGSEQVMRLINTKAEDALRAMSNSEERIAELMSRESDQMKAEREQFERDEGVR
jgi:hypothetical protein